MAGRILREDIERVRDTADLYDIVSAVVTLKSSGAGRYLGLCPFHDEKTPSFHVRPAIGRWHCFGCNLDGDVFEFIMQHESVDFNDAVEILADKYHIELHYDNASAQDEHKGSRRARLLQAMSVAQQFFVKQLLSEDALEARKLLAHRNFTRENCELFGCGYAPRGWDSLVRHLANQGFTQDEMVDAGLARRGQRGVYDYFRGRLTWPIRDTVGQILGFGARKLYDDDTIAGKYINTPDTQLYHKNKVLYGIDLAKKSIVESRQVVIVEGYTDVMACHLAGITNVVATCGTAFGAEHVKIIRRLISDSPLASVQLPGPASGTRVTFTFDGDQAGQKAAMHAFNLDGAFQTLTYVVVAPDNLDPCDFRIERGDEALRKLLENQAQPLFDFVINSVLKQYDLQTIPSRVGALKAVAPIIARIRDVSLSTDYIKDTCRKIGANIDDLMREVQFQRKQIHFSAENYFPTRSALPVQSGAHNGVGNNGVANGLRFSDVMLTPDQLNYRIDDIAFQQEQQCIAMMIQEPLSFDWKSLLYYRAERLFMVLTLREIYEAIVTVGPPNVGDSKARWVSSLISTLAHDGAAHSSSYAKLVNDLAMMRLPITNNDGTPNAQPLTVNGQVSDNSTMQDVVRQQSPEDSRLYTEPSSAVQAYSKALERMLIDRLFVRSIAEKREEMARATTDDEKFQYLKIIGQLEQARKKIDSVSSSRL